MKEVILSIQGAYDHLSKTEKRLADHLIENPQIVIPTSITQLADQAGVSESAIVRFAKKIGFNGYQDLKIALIQQKRTIPINENITRDDSPSDVYDKICTDIYLSLMATKQALNSAALQNCCNALINSSDIAVFGLGNSSSVAQDASHKLFRLGLNAHPYIDNHMQAIAASRMTADSVVIGISHSGSSRDIVDSMRIAKENGAKTIAITNRGKSPINKVSDIILNTSSSETNYRILGLNSRIAQLAIIDAIYSYLFYHLEDTQANIEKVEASLQSKKY